MAPRYRKKFICEACDKSYTRKTDYLLHLKSNTHSKTLREVVDHHKSHGIFVKNISRDTKECDVLEYMCQFGQLKKSLFYKGCAHFLFKEQKSAMIVTSKFEHTIGDHNFNVVPWKYSFVENTEENDEKEEHLLHEEIARALVSNLVFEKELITFLELIKVPDSSHEAELICHHLTYTLGPLYTELSVLPFGSAFTKLAMKGSDMDFDVDHTCTINKFEQGTGDWSINLKATPSYLNAAAVTMQQSGLFSNVLSVTEAKVPIIKFTHNLSGAKCDISFTGAVGIQNSRLIKYYMGLDPRVEQLLVITKYWNKFFQFKKSGLTSYGVVIMTLFYLMQLDVPIIPTVAHLKQDCDKRLFVDGWECSLNTTVAVTNTNNTSVLNLLRGFFEFYAKLDVGLYAICVLTGKQIPKIYFRKSHLLPAEMSLYKKMAWDADNDFSELKIESNMCVQDPFYLNVNVTSRLDTNEVFKLQTVCWSCGNVVRVGEERFSGTGILKRLFKRNIDMSWEWTHTLTHPTIWINVGTYVSPKLALSSEEIQLAWCCIIFQRVKNLFHKICKLEIKEIQHDRGDEVQSFSHYLLCKSEHPNLITNRERVSSILLQYSKLSWLELEAAISERLIKEKGPVEAIKFYCDFRLHTNPTRISLELKATAGDLEGWVEFLKTNLPRWLDNALYYGKKYE